MRSFSSLLAAVSVALSAQSVVVAFVPAPLAFSSSASVTSSTSRSPSLFGRSMDREEDRRHNVEFTNLEPLQESETRRQRIEQDLENRAQFVEFGNDLWSLRNKMNKLSAKLLDAISEGDNTGEKRMRLKLRDAEKRDPELVYLLELTDMADALEQGRIDDAETHRENANRARACLPQFNLEGLWVGKYGSHGYELVNITYVGDTLIAEKVTGDKNVPRGELTFQVDLSPLQKQVSFQEKNRLQQYQQEASTSSSSSSSSSSPQQGHLPPIQLTDKAARKWGTKQLPRYGGLGQVAEEGYSNHQWMDGQLIIIGDEYFSFAWVPIEQQIFFGRPSPELALKMLREQGVLRQNSGASFETPPSMQEGVQVHKEFVTRCLERTDELEDDLEAAPFGCIWKPNDAEECYFE